MGASRLDRLLRPRSVVLIGASATPGALGASVLANLERLKFSGDVHLINPNRDIIGARPCLKSIEELPLGVDVAVLAIPRAGVLGAVRSLVRRQVGAAIIFSAGFAEAGESGRAEQRELAQISTDTGMVIEGPNCLGLVNYVDGTALTFVETPATAPPGSRGIGIVSQSGAMAAVIAVTLAAKELSLSYSISTGNEAASGVEDYVEFLLDEPHTRVIALVVEQFRQPRRFLALARRARRLGKPIVLLHPGRSLAARESAATHTGAMSGDYAVMRMQVRRMGVILTETLEEFGDVLDIVSRCNAAPRGGVGVLTESGAFKALALDICEDVGLNLPVLTDESAPLLRAALPEFVPVSNPVDLTAQGLVDPDLYRRASTAMLQDERLECLMLAIIQTDSTTSNIKFPPIIDTVRQLSPGKAVIFAGLDEGAAVPSTYIAQLRALHIPYFPSPSRAFRALARICSAADVPVSMEDLGEGGTESTLEPHRRRSPGRSITMTEYRSKQILSAAGIPFPQGRMVTTVEEAQRAARALRYPVVLKAQAADLPHKSDAGGVELDIEDDSALSMAWSRLHANVTRHRPDIRLEGVLVESMSRSGVELIIGGRNDAEWGPVMLAGFGGVQAEITKDVRLMSSDSSIAEVVQELFRLQSGEILRGYRGSAALDVEAVATLMSRLGALLDSDPGIEEVDINPVIVYPVGEGVIALDALIVRNADAEDTPA